MPADGGSLHVVAADPAEAAGRLREALGRVSEQQAALDVLAGHLDARRERGGHTAGSAASGTQRR